MKEILLKFESDEEYELFLNILSDSKNIELDSENNIAIKNKDE